MANHESGVAMHSSESAELPASTDQTELRFPANDYLRFDPCEGDRDVDIRCRSVKLAKARKEHACFLAGGPYGDGHTIKPGDIYRHERALVDGDYWGHYRVCVPCMNKWLAGVVCGDEANAK